MVSSAIWAATLLAAVAQAKPEAVVLTSSPFITKPAETATRTVAIYEANNAVRAHLVDRIQETFGIEADSTPPVTPSDATFYVHLDWPSADEVVVGVALPEETLAERSIETNDLETAQAMVWLLVRSTIERALLKPRFQNQVAASQPPPPAVIASSEPAPIQIAMAKRYAISLMGLANLDTGAGAAMNPALQGRMFFSQWLIAGAELSFRHEERVENANVYHVPISGFVGARPWQDLPLEIGAFATFDFKAVRLPNDKGGTGFGFYVGPYARGRWSFYSFSSSELAIVGDFGLGFALKRDRYYVGGAALTDGVVAFRLAGGLEWSWH